MVAECTFNPDYAAAPGEIIEEVLEARGMKKVELASRCGLSPKTISLILSGKAPVTPDTAIQLERVLGIASCTWNNLEANYRLLLAKEYEV
jgi:addiction module HigA family antidote